MLQHTRKRLPQGKKMLCCCATFSGMWGPLCGFLFSRTCWTLCLTPQKLSKTYKNPTAATQCARWHTNTGKYNSNTTILHDGNVRTETEKTVKKCQNTGNNNGNCNNFRWVGSGFWWREVLLLRGWVWDSLTLQRCEKRMLGTVKMRKFGRKGLHMEKRQCVKRQRFLPSQILRGVV